MPLWSLLTVASGLVIVTQAARPLDDPDVWWHVRSGDQILDTHRLPNRETWVWTAVGRRWVPTSWLSDVGFAVAHRWAGWQGVRVLTVIVAAAFAILLASLLHRTSGAVGAASAYALTAAATAGYLRERPQALSLCLVIVLAAWCEDVRRGEPPPWWLVGVVTWIWACLHGMWVLVPPTLVLAAAGCGLRQLRGVLPAAFAAVIAASVTPVGPRLVVQPLVVAHRARDIAEWAPPHVPSWPAALLAVMALLLLRAPRQERLFAAGLIIFGCLAVRDVAPAAVLLSPLLARRVSALLPTSSAQVPTLAQRVPFALGGAVPLLLLLLTPSVSTSVPLQLAARLDRQPGAHVLVDYDIGGLVTGEARRVSAAVDGRTDIYDPDWLHEYLRLTEARSGWQAALDELAPDRALLLGHGALARQLVAQGWHIDESEAQWALLSPPQP